MNEQKKAYLYMHIATFMFGMTAILGKLISLNEFNMVWHRMFLASFVFLLIPSFWKHFKSVPKKIIGIFLLNGIVVAIHWITFYASIKINNNASLTLACFGSVSLFAAILEPLLLKTKFKRNELFLGIAVLIGLVFIASADPNGSISTSSKYFQAIILALVSSVIAVIFTIINKKYIADYNPIVITWAQMTGGFLFLTAMLPFILLSESPFEFIPNNTDIFWIVLLVLFCTNLAFSLEVESLKKMSAFTSSLILNLEPVYGIIAAIIIFNENEMLNNMFYIGASIVIFSIFIHGFLSKKNKSKKNNS